jgi:8-amino-7-oxononanoate synthase
MADFTSALYLGMRHPSAALGSWDALTLGRPAALQEAPGAARLAAALARLQGCEAATLLPSTLHLFWDLFGMLASEPVTILVDAGAYPIARWGAERAHALGVPLRVFARGAVAAAAQLARRALAGGRRPVILADGYCPGAAGAPPLAAYAGIAAAAGGLLVLDDTQVLGLFGPGGGGSLPWHRMQGGQIVVGASLAKGFGAPLAVLAGSAGLVQRFKACSQTRTHASPPSVAAIHAAWRALRLNRASGANLRRSLWQRVAQLQDGLQRIGIDSGGGRFPVQTLRLPAGVDGEALHAGLRRQGVDTVLQMAGTQRVISFLLRADHSCSDIARALAALEQQLEVV